MFQLVMSHIHDEVRNERHDSDSCVPNIADGLVAIQAFQAYIARLSTDYGIEFHLSDTSDSPTTVIAAWASMTGPHGDSSIYVELQRPKPQGDVDRILDLMRTKARYTHLQHPAD